MEALATLSEGDAGVRAIGVTEFVCQFFDVVDDRSPWRWKAWACFTPEEVAALDEVQHLLLEACGAKTRGCFREDIEEDQPFLPG